MTTKLTQLFAELGKHEQDLLLAFAEFLTQRQRDENGSGQGKKPGQLPQKKSVKRPEKETVIHAIKRLSNSYPMLDKAKMLNETYPIMLQHNMEGLSAKETIDALERVFEQYYEKFQASK